MIINKLGNMDNIITGHGATDTTGTTGTTETTGTIRAIGTQILVV
jgi:hypothetical protein